MRHINIPIFIPHLGCPNDCVFCNQKTISGHCNYDKSGVREQIERALETVEKDALVQIAFFGGSFTGIERDEMIYLLSLAKEYIDAGKINSLRLSTRPDYIDENILDILEKYGVKAVELGIQSISDKVLLASNRGHTSEASVRAMKLISERGFELVGQMMIGLPGSGIEDELETARVICECGAKAARIYPTVVFYDTKLCEMAQRGEYTPLTLDDAIERSFRVKSVFVDNGVECIRVGLQSAENLSDASKVYAGDYHDAVGELVDCEIYYSKIAEYIRINSLEDKIRGKNIVIHAPFGEVSKIVGHKKKNKLRLQDEYNVKNIKVIEKKNILRYNIYIDLENE
ncbi:MAG: radical SAM protein [Clostridia bacterium]|nr:radical SAM protein [Clostridia bacterium]